MALMGDSAGAVGPGADPALAAAAGVHVLDADFAVINLEPSLSFGFAAGVRKMLLRQA